MGVWRDEDEVVEEEEVEVDDLEEVVALDVVEEAFEVVVEGSEVDVEFEETEVVEAVEEVEPGEEDDDFEVEVEVEEEEDALEVVDEESVEAFDVDVPFPLLEVEVEVKDEGDALEVIDKESVEVFDVNVPFPLLEVEVEVKDEGDAWEVIDKESVEVFDVKVPFPLPEVVVDEENIFFNPVAPEVLVAVELLFDTVPLEVVDAAPLPVEAIIIDCMTVDVVILAVPEGTSATTALKTLNAAFGAAALTLYSSNRLPAPQYSSLLPGHRKLQSVSLAAGTLPAWRVLPQ